MVVPDRPQMAITYS